MRKTKLTLLLLAALLAGVCIGFYVNDAVIRARVRRFSQIPADLPRHVTDRLTDRLDLDEPQQEQVFDLMMSYDARFTEARERSRALRREVYDSLRTEIDALLTPDQQAAHAQLLEDMEARHRESRALRRAMRPTSPTNTAP